MKQHPHANLQRPSCAKGRQHVLSSAARALTSYSPSAAYECKTAQCFGATMSPSNEGLRHADQQLFEMPLAEALVSAIDVFHLCAELANSSKVAHSEHDMIRPWSCPQRCPQRRRRNGSMALAAGEAGKGWQQGSNHAGSTCTTCQSPGDTRECLHCGEQTMHCA